MLFDFIFSVKNYFFKPSKPDCLTIFKEMTECLDKYDDIQKCKKHFIRYDTYCKR